MCFKILMPQLPGRYYEMPRLIADREDTELLYLFHPILSQQKRNNRNEGGEISDANSR